MKWILGIYKFPKHHVDTRPLRWRATECRILQTSLPKTRVNYQKKAHYHFTTCFFSFSTLPTTWLQWVFCVNFKPRYTLLKNFWKSNLRLCRLNINNSCSTRPILCSRYMNRHFLLPHSCGSRPARPTRASVLQPWTCSALETSVLSIKILIAVQITSSKQILPLHSLCIWGFIYPRDACIDSADDK